MVIPRVTSNPSRRAAVAARMTGLLALSAGLATAAATVLAAPATAAPATAEIKDAGTASVVKDSFVVVLKDSSAVRSRGVPATASSLTTRYGGRVGRTYSSALRGFELSVTESAAEELAADPAVAHVQRNGIYRIQATQSGPPWGLDRIDQRNLPLSSTYTYSQTAPDVHAYIIDTGIRFSHNQFGGRAVSGTDTISNDADASDCQGHGTHVAGTVGGSTYGVAKNVRLVGVRVLDCGGGGTTATIVAGLDWVTANAVKPAVANMSLGGPADGIIDAAVNRSVASGVTYAVAAGNGNRLGIAQPACNYSPARVPGAITVSATSRTDAKASWANYGSCVDIFAPGVDVTSAWWSSNTATHTTSGTSMAAPHVAGAAAIVLQTNPGYTPAQVSSALVTAATSGVVVSPGTGSPNRLLFTQ